MVFPDRECHLKLEKILAGWLKEKILHLKAQDSSGECNLWRSCGFHRSPVKEADYLLNCFLGPLMYSHGAGHGIWAKPATAKRCTISEPVGRHHRSPILVPCQNAIKTAHSPSSTSAQLSGSSIHSGSHTYFMFFHTIFKKSFLKIAH